MFRDKALDLRIDQLPPTPAAEDAVVTGALGLKVGLLGVDNAGAQVVGSAGLARARDVVELTFDGEQRGGFDVLRSHALDLTVFIFDVPSAMHQALVLEHHLDGLQIVVCIHVENSVVFVIELAVIFGSGIVPLDQVFEVIVVTL